MRIAVHHHSPPGDCRLVNKAVPRVITSFLADELNIVRDRSGCSRWTTLNSPCRWTTAEFWFDACPRYCLQLWWSSAATPKRCRGSPAVGWDLQLTMDVKSSTKIGRSFNIE